MRARLFQAWYYIRSSYWFIPTLMAIAAAIAAFACVAIDRRIDVEQIRDIPLLCTSTPETARTLLATIAGAMITVAGVTFAITISSVGYATAQYGPRILTNYMRDRGNQISLGAFLANFLYCLLTLRSVQSPVEGNDFAEVFIPHVSIVVGMVTTIACAGVLIYYIHHIPESIHVANVLKAIGRELDRKIEQLFPERIGHGDDEGAIGEAIEGSAPTTEGRDVLAESSGYVQTLDDEGLLSIARESNIVVTLRCRPGDFAYTGLPLATLHNARADDEVLCNRIRSVIALGAQRTPDQDNRFLVNELVEIAARALSPGQNDPFTAISAIDWLKAALARRLGRRTPSTRRLDDSGALRVIARTSTHCDMIDDYCDQLRPYVITDRNAGLAYMRSLVELSSVSSSTAAHGRLRLKASEFLDGAESRNWQTCDLNDVKRMIGEMG
ncbi:MAG TPA: DUF2254 domain-containing protein [Phycisphaerae bacterium]|nr:DUF2254 domain-containing protein [Phycisphaerae bacterium]HRW52437.1 DUF2254 domain-containing protein [Phycisphaerae bacterium]